MQKISLERNYSGIALGRVFGGIYRLLINSQKKKIETERMIVFDCRKVDSKDIIVL